MKPFSNFKPYLMHVPFFERIKRVVDRRNRMSVFRKDFDLFSELSDRSEARFKLDWSDRWPCLDDRTIETGFDHHYVLHTAWASRVLARLKPLRHVDVSSNLYFVAACSAIIPIEFYDYRPVNLKLDNLRCHKGDLMRLPFEDESVESLSCMHVVEHIGLGRYGDPFDTEGDLKATRELGRVVKIGGSLLYVVPVGGARIQFNAHRIYSHEQILKAFPNYRLRESALIPDVNSGGWITNPSPEQMNAQKYGCGCFLFERCE